jgi:hypothetical protein
MGHENWYSVAERAVTEPDPVISTAEEFQAKAEPMTNHVQWTLLTPPHRRMSVDTILGFMEPFLM